MALCGARPAIHHVGLLHQDIKADNVMRERGGRIVLMDFGAAAVAAAPPGSLARGRFGSPHYIAPELLDRRGLVFAAERPLQPRRAAVLPGHRDVPRHW